MSLPPPPDPLAAHAVALADKVAVVDDRPDGTLVRWTFSELNAQANRLAHALAALGVKRGDRVVWCGQNSPGVVRMVHAARKLGAVAVPLNYRLTAEEAQYVVDDSDAVLAYVDAEMAPLFREIRPRIPKVREVLVYGGAPLDGQRDVEPLAAAASDAEPPPAPPGTVTPQAMIYTSGTTGRPKGAMLTHGNLWWNNCMTLLTSDTLESDVTLVVAPLFHIGGLNVTTLTAFMKGAEVVLQRGFDPGRWIEDVVKYKVTTAFAVPAMLLAVSQHPAFASSDLSCMRMIICGGAPVPEPLLKLYAKRGLPINQGYGLTETAPMVTFLTSEWGEAKLGSAGRSGFFVDVALMDPDGKFLKEPMVRGEVVARGPNVMKGYWNKPEATAAAIDAAGWFHTGDVGYFDADGFLYICDRVKDMVITGGENVYPAEVEAVFYAHPAISEIAIIGQPDPKWGEAVVAVVVLKTGQKLTLEEMRAWGTERLARYKLPSRLEVIEAMPRNPAGKVLKFELRKRLVG